MGDRKRVNISLDPASYERLREIQQAYGFKNLCEMLVAMAHILIDRTEPADKRIYDLPEDEGRYIDAMFDELGNTNKIGDAVPVRRNSRHIR